MKESTVQPEKMKKDPRDIGIIQKKDRDGNPVFFARIVRREGSGKPKQYTARANDKSHARRLLKELREKYDDRGERAIDGDKMTFRQLAGEYEAKKLIPAQFHEGNGGVRKIAGRKSLAGPKTYLKTLVAHFGNKRIKGITHADIEAFRHLRLKSPIERKDKEGKVHSTKERAIASVQRELEVMRGCLRFAYKQGWLVRSPFDMGEPLISKADEVRRERVLSHEEERRLLTACGERTVTYKRGKKEITAQDKGKRRKHLRPLLIAALETAMRRGELLKLIWRDVDFELGIIYVRATNTKTERARIVPITAKLKDELLRMGRQNANPDSLVFGITDTIKNSFKKLCDIAGVDNFRLHDCRHTAITRMIAAGVSTPEVMKISGHTQMTTFLRYLNPTNESLQRAANLLHEYNTAASAAMEAGYVH
jgi:integrase